MAGWAVYTDYNTLYGLPLGNPFRPSVPINMFLTFNLQSARVYFRLFIKLAHLHRVPLDFVLANHSHEQYHVDPISTVRRRSSPSQVQVQVDSIADRLDSNRMDPMGSQLEPCAELLSDAI